MEHPDIFTPTCAVPAHVSAVPAHFGRLDLTFPQALVLTALGDGDPVPISTLAERTGSANSTVSGIVDRLEKLGLAKRERSELDRRVIYVSATQRYAELKQKTSTDVGGYFDSLLHDMSGEDRNLIATALGKLDAALAQAEGKER